MFGKVKKWFGVEGVKVELILPEAATKAANEIKGQLKFSTMNAQTVSGIEIKLIELYSRGRKKNKLTTEYTVGEITLYETFEVVPDKPIVLNFTLPFELLKSEMDEMEESNFFYKGVAKLAKYSRGVQSVFRVEVQANVAGTRLNPFDKKEIVLN